MDLNARIHIFFISTPSVPSVGCRNVLGSVFIAALLGDSLVGQFGTRHSSPQWQPLARVTQFRFLFEGLIPLTGPDSRLSIYHPWDQTKCRGRPDLPDYHCGGAITTCYYLDVHLFSSKVQAKGESCFAIGATKGTWDERIQSQAWEVTWLSLVRRGNKA